MKAHLRHPAARHQYGGSIAELAPVLFVIFILIAFPLIDLIALPMIYFCGSSLNSAQVREAALQHYSEVRDNPNGQVVKVIPDQWKNNGLGRFCKLASPLQTAVTYKEGVAGDKVVIVSTTIVANPLVTIPFFQGLPGIGAPVTFSYTNERIVENPENAP